jgi:hypothetical protein
MCFVPSDVSRKFYFVVSEFFFIPPPGFAAGESTTLPDVADKALKAVADNGAVGWMALVATLALLFAGYTVYASMSMLKALMAMLKKK